MHRLEPRNVSYLSSETTCPDIIGGNAQRFHKTGEFTRRHRISHILSHRMRRRVVLFGAIKTSWKIHENSRHRGSYCHTFHQPCLHWNAILSDRKIHMSALCTSKVLSALRPQFGWNERTKKHHGHSAPRNSLHCHFRDQFPGRFVAKPRPAYWGLEGQRILGG